MCFWKDDWKICELAIFNSKGRQVQYVCCQFSQITVLSRIYILAIKSKAVFSIWPQRNCCVGIDCSLQWTERRLQFRLLLLLSRFSRVRLCVTPWTAAYQAPPSMGFSRQEYWSGVPSNLDWETIKKYFTSNQEKKPLWSLNYMDWLFKLIKEIRLFPKCGPQFTLIISSQ